MQNYGNVNDQILICKLIQMYLVNGRSEQIL